jgi:hypothetical protein
MSTQSVLLLVFGILVVVLLLGIALILTRQRWRARKTVVVEDIVPDLPAPQPEKRARPGRNILAQPVLKAGEVLDDSALPEVDVDAFRKRMKAQRAQFLDNIRKSTRQTLQAGAIDYEALLKKADNK